MIPSQWHPERRIAITPGRRPGRNSPTRSKFSTCRREIRSSPYVYVGDSQGNINPLGDYAWFLIQDLDPLNFQLFVGSTKLGKSFGFLGTSAEWIVERPVVSGYFHELSDYRSLAMSGAGFVPFGATSTIPYSQATNIYVNPFAPVSQLQQLTMTDSNTPPWYDNNVLSTVSGSSSCSTCMSFTWKNYH